MTWLAQVRHIMAKDLREARWSIAAYAIIVALATAHATSMFAGPSDLLDMSMMFVVLSGMLVVALFIQSDSPTRSDAFWASRPFIPSAMLAAKLALATIVIGGLALIGQLAGLSAHGVVARNMPGLLAQSGWAYALWLLVALVVAALTKDVRGAFLAVLIIPLFLVVVLGSFFGTNQHVPTTTQYLIAVLLPVIGVGGGLGLLVLLYRTRDTRRRTRLAGFVVLCCILLSIAMPWPSRADVIDAPVSEPRVTLKLFVSNVNRITVDPQIRLDVSVEGGSKVERLILTDGMVLVHLRSGSVLRLPVRNSLTELSPRALPEMPGVNWSGAHADDRARYGLSVELTYDQRKAISEGVTRIGLEGRVSASEPRIVGTMPLERGAIMAHDGRQIRITEWAHGFGDAWVNITTSWVDQGRDPASMMSFYSLNDVQFALLNEARGEAVSLYGSGGGGSGYLVLPGIQLRQTTSQFKSSLVGANVAAGPLDDAWIRGARLMVVDWIPRGSYPVHAEMELPH